MLPCETRPHILQQSVLYLLGALQVHYWDGGPGVHRELQVQVSVCHPFGSLCHPYIHPPAQHAYCTDGGNCEQNCTGEQEHLETPGTLVMLSKKEGMGNHKKF